MLCNVLVLTFICEVPITLYSRVGILSVNESELAVTQLIFTMLFITYSESFAADVRKPLSGCNLEHIAESQKCYTV